MLFMKPETKLDPAKEAETVFELCSRDVKETLLLLETQLNTIHTRVQVLLSFCGIVITTTGFSGRLIAGTHLAAQLFIVIGLAMMVICAGYVFDRVGSVRWITRDLDLNNPLETVRQIIERRNLKTRAYRRGGYFLFLGLIFYSISIAIMLLNPHVLDVPVR